MNNLPLGKSVEYKNTYDASLLCPVSRVIGRKAIGIADTPPFYGVDIWNCYEISWLNNKGKPEVRVAELRIPVTSPNIVESKSLKLYLNSFNNSCFINEAEVLAHISRDLKAICGAEIAASLKSVHSKVVYEEPKGQCIDALDIICDNYETNASFLQLEQNAQIVHEMLYSDLLKANCLITNQPDFASVEIEYTGRKINHESLLTYIVSFRNHNEFHEQCAERIYHDIMKYASPQKLTVYARFTRRGGIDINPFRSSQTIDPSMIKNIRSSRQ
jgi:7-cyano-7-deazaguanine reductase